MAKKGDIPATLNQRTARRLLEAHDWTMEVGGRHNVKMTKPGHRPITLPQHKGGDYGPDLRRGILKAAGLA